MNGTQLEKVVALGLGRAVVYLLDHDARPDHEIILDACLHSKAYNPQVEGSRAVYLKDLMLASGDQPIFEQAVVTSLSQRGDDWDTTQRLCHHRATSWRSMAYQATFDASVNMIRILLQKLSCGIEPKA